MKIAALRRYPVKCMGGEPLSAVALDARGLVGDRWWAVVDTDGKLASAKNTHRFRRRDAVLEFAATTRRGEVVVQRAGREWVVGDAALEAELTSACGVGLWVRPEADVDHQDSVSISLVGSATLDWCAERWGIAADPRRLRVNLVLATDEPFVEESWAGHELRLGEVVLEVGQPIPRCRTVDLDQDGATAHGAWLKPLAAERDTCLAVGARVVRPGELRVGDEVNPSATTT